MGTLYLVSTPVGNLEDLSARAIRILGEVDVVLAEDTRRTKGLLHHLKLRAPLLSLHAHNERARAEEVLDRLARGEALALVSDAGTPLVSDPGERLVRAAIELGHQIVPIPGPSAVLHALVGSGFATTPFTFLGFVPRKGRERKLILERVARSTETTVLFEAPGRTRALLVDLEALCGPTRRAAVARELTKLHEEFRRGTVSELARYYKDAAPRGEVTIVVEPNQPNPGRGADGEPSAAADEPAAAVSPETEGRAFAVSLLGSGLPPSRAAREVAAKLGIPRNAAYDLVMEISRTAANRDPE